MPLDFPADFLGPRPTKKQMELVKNFEAAEFEADMELFFDTLFNQMTAGAISSEEVERRFFKKNWVCGYSDCGKKKETESGLCSTCGRFPTVHALSKPATEDADA